MMVAQAPEAGRVDPQDVIEAIRRQADADMRAARRKWGAEIFRSEPPGRKYGRRAVRITPALQEAARALDARGPMTVMEVAHDLGITEAAARTRLRDLRRIGLADVVGQGYPRRYAATARAACRKG